MSDKYVIRNCPCFYEENEEVNDYTCSWSGTEELACQDCTNCVMKQIVKLCKHDIEQWKAVLNENILEGCVSNKILQLLDIKEVE